MEVMLDVFIRQIGSLRLVAQGGVHVHEQRVPNLMQSTDTSVQEFKMTPSRFPWHKDNKNRDVCKQAFRRKIPLWGPGAVLNRLWQSLQIDSVSRRGAGLQSRNMKAQSGLLKGHECMMQSSLAVR